MPYTPGYGDEATWGPYTGHPNDPRAPDDLDIEDFGPEEGEAAVVKSFADSLAGCTQQEVDSLMREYEAGRKQRLGK